MKIILAPKILKAIDEAIDKHGDGICRIELSLSEYRRFLEDLENHHPTLLRDSSKPNTIASSGDYIRYRGVSVQTHADYPTTEQLL